VRLVRFVGLGVLKPDAAGIAYAVERSWLLISGGPHSLSLTKAGWQRLVVS